MSAGYAHRLYAQSLSEFGTPQLLRGCGGWVLERPIPNTSWRDVMGCYPVFCCTDWSKLGEEFQSLGSELVSLSMVCDPFGNFTPDRLAALFDLAVPFKQHFLVDLGAVRKINKHHRYYARRALRHVSIERAAEPARFVDEWVALYGNLVRRHELRGIKAFSRKAFEAQMNVPGLVMLRAISGGEAVAVHLWFVQGPVAYSHLMAMNDQGYAGSVSYALYGEAIWRAAELFGQEVRILNLGAGAGVGAEATDGLTLFKRGWANASRPVYFCGRVFDSRKYAACVAAARREGSGYFPAYREGEFV